LMLDIQLTDGLSLELFQGRQLSIPTIFTTAYNHFAIDAFQALAVDYLLKPVSETALAAALAKTQRLRQQFGAEVSPALARMPPAVAERASASTPLWRQRLVGRKGQQFHALAIEQVAYVVALGKGRLQLELRPALQGDVSISQERAAAFRAWIGG
jgi:DNA-binding LytR/AlgR family response regulator